MREPGEASQGGSAPTTSVYAILRKKGHTVGGVQPFCKEYFVPFGLPVESVREKGCGVMPSHTRILPKDPQVVNL